ncbi:membrane-bound acylglycerophosphatidylinositol O-acyltransferase MBOAT7-like [Crassostrea virginica]
MSSIEMVTVSDALKAQGSNFIQVHSNISKASVEYNYETIHSLSIYGCELGRTTKEGLRSWNMTIQYWLAANCHHRLPHSLKVYWVAITMTISASRHGIYPGYYLNFDHVSVLHTDRRGQHEGSLQTRLPSADPVL